MLIRISLIVAILAGLAVGGLNIVKVKEKVTTLQTNLKTETEAHATSENNFQKTKRDLTKTQGQLTETNQLLVSTQGERDKAVADAATQTKRATQLAEDLGKTKKELADTQSDLGAYKNSGFTPQQVLNLGKTLKQTEDNLAGAKEENLVLNKHIEKLKNELAKYTEGNERIVFMKAGIKGQIVVSDPKWDFVVLNVGDDQGVKEDGELLVSRNGKLVAKVKVRNVEKSRSIANVLPGWKLGEVLEGDQVIPAHPES